jgi:hypothetical protein
MILKRQHNRPKAYPLARFDTKDVKPSISAAAGS